ncbi:ATP-binding protein [Candidatus Odyssella thessalonicensis]|uniref:ATP-binding protein n=1 Tax=Candidatus Odyssella thessalonicensis TaxID=84647 RepID=UPI000225B497|nr:ATP-binding protein [Candidatus Odyssella thessalonicensis]
MKITFNILLIYNLFCYASIYQEIHAADKSEDSQSRVPNMQVWGVTEEDADYLFENCQDLVCIVEGGSYTRLNNNWKEVLGWDLEELYSRPYIDFVHPKDVQKTLQYEAYPNRFGLLNRFRTKEGGYRWLDWIVLPRLGEQKERNCSIQLARDITERKVLEKEARRHLKYVSKDLSAENTLLSGLSKIQSAYIKDIFGGITENQFAKKAIIKSFILATKSRFGVIATFWPDGHPKITLSKAYIRLSTATPSEKSLKRIEITSYPHQRRRIKNLLKETINKQEYLIKSLQQSNFSAGEDQEPFPLLNFLSIPLLLKNEVIGIVGLSGSDLGYSQELVDWLAPFCALSTRIINEERSYKRIESDRLRKVKEAEEEAKARVAFSSHISHEIRTPLTGMIALLDLINPSPLPDEERDYLRITKSSAASLLQITNDILDFSKIEMSQLKLETIQFNPFSVVKEVTELLAPQMESKGLTMKYTIDHAVPDNFVGDPTRFRQILFNLIGNAIKFTEKGGIRISLKVKAYLEKQTQQQIPGLYCAVKDTGIGISEEGRSLIFKPFKQADATVTRQFGGTGLGLYISQQLCKLMNGDIGFKSEVGKGSTFYFYIPLRQQPKAKVESQEDKPLISTQIPPSLRVLVADDNVVNQIVIKALLNKLGCQITTVSNGKEALEILNREKFDIVLMDGQMPIMDGLTATRYIRESYDRIALPIIGVTASALKEDREEFFGAGINGYLEKPINMPHLKEEISRCLLENKYAFNLHNT